ncbi:CBS domain-containing protein [Galbibacter pacificus]|uniref:CBS domain-containing protein n=1 Tax=Galbibacter pacificus TaxID=2996052 RepID=A0ABT6FT79_9FLAO|nr:CBS domain-containing protein [Galbibacter pacificus]MDG3582408.1 CBS domain-containing protein [Galbibacter pacificus]MDG3586474.1 CBS domain-containing protein [Galbibacter pacificus]
MNIHSYINNDVLPLLPNYPVKMVRGMFSNCTNTHIPVVEDNRLLGNISEDDVQGFDPDKKISDYLYALDLFYVQKSTNWLDVLEAFAKFNSNILPILDENSIYVGYYELIDIMSLFKETPFLNEPGGILIVEKGHTDYSFSEISQIVESNDGKLLGAFISNDAEDVTQITMKIGNIGLNNIIQTFRRYNYNIVSGNEEDSYIEGLKLRSDYLNKFLKI